jgi:DNA phosphorothioation-dependent restriction protein DptG
MKLNYINVVTNNSVWVINRLSNLLRKRNYSIEAFSAAFDEKWYGHILIWIELNEWEEIEQVISQIYKLFDVKEVTDMTDYKKQVRYMFNVNCNCKKTLKKISREPDKIIETDKELI